jgi:hypothetical protein
LIGEQVKTGLRHIRKKGRVGETESGGKGEGEKRRRGDWEKKRQKTKDKREFYYES